MKTFIDNFEEGFTADPAGAGNVPNGWSYTWIEDPKAGILDRPELAAKDAQAGQSEVFAGRYSACLFTTHASHHAALFRTFYLDSPSTSVLVSCQNMIVCHDDGGKKGGMGMRIGIAPGFVTDIQSVAIQWGEEWFSTHTPGWKERVWGPLEYETPIAAQAFTVFLASKSDYPVDISAAHWDNVHVVVQEGGGPPLPPPVTGEGVEFHLSEAAAHIEQARATYHILAESVISAYGSL